jgi:hypothetical protein
MLTPFLSKEPLSWDTQAVDGRMTNIIKDFPFVKGKN